MAFRTPSSASYEFGVMPVNPASKAGSAVRSTPWHRQLAPIKECPVVVQSTSDALTIQKKRIEELLAQELLEIVQKSHSRESKTRIQLNVYKVGERYFRWTITRYETIIAESPANKHARSLKECVVAVAQVLSAGAQAEQLIIQTH